jgi:two-component system, chemotaxis family, response regulator Rcp1
MPHVLLLVEDNPADAELTRFALEDAGIGGDLVVVEDGTDALDYLRGSGSFEDAVRPAVVLLDIRLPRLDGTEVLRQIRADDDLRSLPVVMLTADDDLVGALGDLVDDCDGHLIKPIDGDRLRQVFDALRA